MSSLTNPPVPPLPDHAEPSAPSTTSAPSDVAPAHVRPPATVGLSTVVPVGWSVVEAPAVELGLVAPDRPGFRPNVTFERGRVEPGLPDEEVVDRTRAGLQERSATTIGAEYRTVVSGWPAVERVFRIVEPDGVLVGRQVVVLPPLATGRGVRELVVVTAMAAAADVAVLDTALATVLAHLVVTPSPASPVSPVSPVSPA